MTSTSYLAAGSPTWSNLRPGGLALGGGVSAAGSFLWSGAQKAAGADRLQNHAYARGESRTLGNDAGLIGAPWLAMRAENPPDKDLTMPEKNGNKGNSFGQFFGHKREPRRAHYIAAANDALGVTGTPSTAAHAQGPGAAPPGVKRYGGSEREVELARIAGTCTTWEHDQTASHTRSLRFDGLPESLRLGMPRGSAVVCTAIGNHDEGAARWSTAWGRR